jgi:hypothetical protein
MRKGSQNIVYTHTIACKEFEYADWVHILYLKTEISFAYFLNNQISMQTIQILET